MVKFLGFEIQDNQNEKRIETPLDLFQKTGKIIGYSIFPIPPKFSFQNGYITLTSFILCFYPVVQLIRLTKPDSLSGNLEALLFLSVSIHIISKHMNLVVKQERVKKLVDLVEEMYWTSFDNHKEKLLRVQNITKKIIYFLGTGFIGVVITLFGMPFVTDKMYLPIGNIWFLNDSFFLFIFILEFFTFTISTVSYHMHCCFFIPMTLQISTQVEILEEEITSFGQITRDRNKTDEMFQLFVTNTVEHHNKIIRAVRQLNSIISSGLFCEMIMASIQCCLTTYILGKTIGSQDPTKYIMFTVCFISATFTPLIISFCGNAIDQKRVNLQETIYKYPWYEEPPRNRKKFLMVLFAAATAPLNLNFRGFVTFGLSQYASMLQAAYSYIALLNHVVGTNNN